MRSRLFWKIFWNFGLTFLLQLFLMWVMFTFVMTPNTGLLRLVAERSAPQTLDLAARLLTIGGPTAVPPDVAGGRLHIKIADARTSPSSAGPARLARAPDGRLYQLEVSLPSVAMSPGAIAPEIYMVGLVTGLLSSAMLAFYLAKPIRILRAGFESFAAGDLRTRLGASIGNRRDEIADLARDFDGMASEIEQLVRARDQLLDDVSHELRSPLTRLQLAIALARQKGDGVEAFHRIEREASRLERMVGELLTLSRLESGVPLTPGYCDLVALLEEVAEDARFEGRSRKIAVLLNIDGEGCDGTVEVPGDPELMRRTFENIVRNALRHSPPGGSIRIAVRSLDCSATVTIGDEGHGVPPEELATLFAPFVKRGGGPGWGLGLAIAQRAVIAHGGIITASNEPGAGLQVAVMLPLGPAPSD